jgi:hypothetical protein
VLIQGNLTESWAKCVQDQGLGIKMSNGFFNILSLIIGLSGSLAFAQTQSSTAPLATVVKKESVVSGKIALENSQNLFVDSDPTKTNATELTLWPTFKIGKNANLSVLSVIKKDHREPQDTTLSNTALL